MLLTHTQNKPIELVCIWYSKFLKYEEHDNKFKSDSTKNKILWYTVVSHFMCKPISSPPNREVVFIP